MANGGSPERVDRPILGIKNFKSIKAQRVELAPLTILYGPNGAGKSTLIHALLTLRNLSLNPNQAVGAFFNYSFLNLGGFQAVVFDHDVHKKIELTLDWKDDGHAASYAANFGESSGKLSVLVTESGEQPEPFELSVAFPYPLNQQAKREISRTEGTFTVSWNGVTASAQVATPGQEALDRANLFLERVNEVTAKIKAVSVAPPTRLFTEPQYSATSVSPWAVKAEEVATLLSNEKYLVHKVSHYLEGVVDRDFRVNSKPGAAFFSLDVTDRKTGLGTELVNDGSGVNQLVYVMAKTLSQDTERVCIEEPEIHLHPTAVGRLARTIAGIMSEEGKNFVISTHSEPFMLAVLGLVRSGQLKADTVAIYLVSKQRRESIFERQLVNDQGQVEGGLRALIEGELEDVKAFLFEPGGSEREGHGGPTQGRPE